MNTSTKLIIIGFFISILPYSTTFAQDVAEETIEIMTSSVCAMCKSTIEKGLKKEEGVNKAKHDPKTKIVTVLYDPALTSPESIRKAVTMTGYDADSLVADPTAYSKLHGCCKKDVKH